LPRRVRTAYSRPRCLPHPRVGKPFPDSSQIRAGAKTLRLPLYRLSLLRRHPGTNEVFLVGSATPKPLDNLAPWSLDNSREKKVMAQNTGGLCTVVLAHSCFDASSLFTPYQILSRPIPFDPQPDPRQEKPRRRQRSEPHTDVSRYGGKSVKRRQKRSVSFQTAIRDHEAVGSNPATRTTNPPESVDFGGFS